MDKNLQELRKALGENRLRENEPMNIHTAFKTGGAARYYFEAQTIDELTQAILTALKLEIPYFVLGSGTQLIISEKGIEGIVIKNNSRKFEVAGLSGRVRNQEVGVDNALVYAESGVIFNQLVRYLIDQGWGGLEYQLGLPGTVGGALYKNSGLPCKKAFVGDEVFQARIVKKDGSIQNVEAEYFKFGYDRSTIVDTGDVVLMVVFKLKKEDKTLLWERANEAMSYRTSTQPKKLCKGYVYRTIGIEGGNVPIVDRITAASNVIRKLGMAGKRIGDALLAQDQPNYLLNFDNASDEDLKLLESSVKEKALEELGITLHLDFRPVE